MNILILGCSWAVPNYFGGEGDLPETHTEMLLKTLGHQVYNCAINGGSNMQSLNRARACIRGEPIQHPAYKTKIIQYTTPITIDLLVWFHTDLGRDTSIVNNIDCSIDQQLSKICNLVYKDYANFINELQCKVAIIGGCSDIHQSLYKYIQPNFCLPSWQKKLINASSMGFRFNLVKNPTKKDIEFLDNAKLVISLMKKSKLFPDNCHPGGIAHKELVDILSNVFNLGV